MCAREYVLMQEVMFGVTNNKDMPACAYEIFRAIQQVEDEETNSITNH